ncbi:MAG: CHC2 zinc finger domain-containing protein [bacterium]|nr:CHC2 zinc finger domain-containing protein [bacterium]
MGHYRDLVERIKHDLTMDKLVPHHTGRKPICCPLPGHADKNGSFIVYSETNSWWCPSHQTTPCGGSPIDYVMAEQGVSFKEAVKISADLLGIEMRPPTEEEKAEVEARHQREEVLTVVAQVAHSWLLMENSTAASARDYLLSRGFTEDLIKDQCLGLLDLQKLYEWRERHPRLEAFSKEDFDAAGLRNKSGNILFLGPRLSIPLLARQRVTGMTFRTLDPTEKRKYMHLAGQPAGLYNEDALGHKSRKVVVTEGVPDCWTAMQFGHQAVACLGVEASKHADLFRGQRRVTLIWDNDDTGRGRVLKSARAIQAAMPDGEVCILHMPEVNDLNDWARAGGTKEEFQALLDGAPDLVEYQIAQLPDVKAGERLTRDAQATLRELLADVRALEGNLQDIHLKTIAAQVGSRPTSLREMMRAQAKTIPAPTLTFKAQESPSTSAQPTPGSGVVFKDEVPYRAALGFDFRETPTANIGVWLRPRSDEPYSPFVIESTSQDGKAVVSLVPYAERSTQSKGRIRFPNEGLPRWTRGDAPFSMERLLADPEGNTPNAAKVFMRMRDLIKRFIWYPADHEYDIVTLWVMMTYFFPVFGRVGYLHFNGGSGSGKSLSLRFIESLAFNAIKTSNISDAALYRTVDGSQSTLLMDEAEKLSFPKAGTIEAATRSLFLDSYADGALVYRMNTETNQVEAFDAFSPKCLGSISKIDPVFGNRCVTIHCLRKQKGINLFHHAQKVEEVARLSADLRNMMHCMALTRFHEVWRIYTVDLMGAYTEIENREYEIWISLIAMARLVDQDAQWDETKSLVDIILTTQRKKEAEREEEARRESVDILILQTTLNLITGDNQRDYDVFGEAWKFVGKGLAKAIQAELDEDGAWPFEKDLTSNRLTNLLKTQHVIEEADITRITVGGARKRILKIRPDNLRQALQRMHGLDAEEAVSEPTVLASAAPAPPQAAPRPVQATIHDAEDLPF